MLEIYKKKYQTSLEALEELRLARSELKDEVLSYNGILDPMAEGVLPILVGEEENKNRDRFTGSEKVYEVGILVGISTDSSDLLGIVTKTIDDRQETIDPIVKTFLDYPRQFNQTVPMHSNRKVDGKRLWWWILNGVEIPKEKRPVNSVEIKDIEVVKNGVLSLRELQNEIQSMSEQIGERFRLDKVIPSWQNYFKTTIAEKFSLITLRIHVTSGFYVRTFVQDISDQLGIPLVVYSLKRTKIIHVPGK